MDSGKPSTAVDAEIQRLARALEAEVAARKGASRAATMTTMVLCCIILFFVVLNFFYFRSEWTEENFKHSIEREMQELKPMAQRELQTMGQELLPVYYDEGKRQLNNMMPEISQTMKKEIDRLGEDLFERVHTRLAQSLVSFSDTAQKEILEQYPELDKPENHAELEKRLRGVTDRAVLSCLVQFDRRFRKDVDDVTATLLRFDVSDQKDTIDLQKKFIRLWLQLLDLEVMEL